MIFCYFNDIIVVTPFTSKYYLDYSINKNLKIQKHDFQEYLNHYFSIQE
jgi:hypothetical protein